MLRYSQEKVGLIAWLGPLGRRGGLCYLCHDRGVELGSHLVF